MCASPGGAGAAIGGGSALARDLANLPPNVCTPSYIAKRAEDLEKEWSRIKTTVLDETAIKELKMGAFLAVTQGSTQPPRFIVGVALPAVASFASRLGIVAVFLAAFSIPVAADPDPAFGL